MAKKTKFPRTMFQLTPAFHVREIKLVGPAMTRGWGSGKEIERTGYGVDDKGKDHWLCRLFDSRALALEAAENAINDQEARHKIAGENIAKRRANLEKAKAKA